MAAVLGDCLPCPVVCSSSWLCQGDLAAVLHVADPDPAAVRETSREDCVILEAPSPAEVVPPCTLSLACVAQGKDRILNVSVCSEARTVEVYSGSQDGQEEEYLGTSRGEKFCTFADSGDDLSCLVTLYKAHLKLDFPVPSCKVKLLSLGGRNSVFVSQITVQVTSVPERCSQSPSLLGPSIDMERVQSIMDSMGGKMSPGAEQLMSMMCAQQKHQIPFSANLLQLFGSFQPGRGQKMEAVGQITHQANTTDTKIEIPQSKTSETPPSVQQLSAPESDIRSIMSSLLQNQTSQASPTPDSLLPLLRDLCGKKKPGGESRQESPREEKLDTSLEKLLSGHMERMERNLMDHIDHRMKTLQKHLDTRLDHIETLIHSCDSDSWSGKTAEKLVNGQTNYSSEQERDLDVF